MEPFKDTFGAPLSPKFRLTPRTPSNPATPKKQQSINDDSYEDWKKRTTSSVTNIDMELLALTKQLSEQSNPFGDTPASSSRSYQSTDRTTALDTRVIRGDPAKSQTILIMRRRKKEQKSQRPIPGYTGHLRGSICKEKIPPTVTFEDERALRQDLSLSLGMGMGRNDVSSFSPIMSTGNSILSESAFLAKKPEFQLSEGAFQSKTTDFILHRMATMKFERGRGIMNHDAARVKRKKGGHGSPTSVVTAHSSISTMSTRLPNNRKRLR